MTDSHGHAHKRKILVVDDEREMCDLVQDYPLAKGYEVDKALTASQAIQQFHACDYDIVVSDSRMPEMDGMELLKALKKARPDTPVILITAFGSIDLAIAAMKAGAFYFLTKPFKLRGHGIVPSETPGKENIVERGDDPLRGNRCP